MYQDAELPQGLHRLFNYDLCHSLFSFLPHDLTVSQHFHKHSIFAAQLQPSSQRNTESRPDPRRYCAAELENELRDKVLFANRGVVCSGSSVCVENGGESEQRRAEVFL